MDKYRRDPSSCNCEPMDYTKHFRLNHTTMKCSVCEKTWAHFTHEDDFGGKVLF